MGLGSNEVSPPELDKLRQRGGNTMDSKEIVEPDGEVASPTKKLEVKYPGYFQSVFTFLAVFFMAASMRGTSK